LVPWLAEEAPIYDAANLSYTVKLREAKWSDGSEVTSEDVAFTGRIIEDFKVSQYISRWRFIDKIETPDKHTVVFYLKEPMAIFEERTLMTPIIQKKQWAQIIEEVRQKENPEKELLNYKVKNPTGCGPYALKEWRRGSYLFVEKNEHFFGEGQEINGRTLGPFVDGVIFSFYGTTDAAVLALKKGTMDFYWWHISAGYIGDLEKDKNIQLFSNKRSALYYMGFNVRKPPYNDPAFRQAVATMIDPDFIITRILQGHGDKMSSIIPDGNKKWHCSGLPRYGEGLDKASRIKKAYEILSKAGYTWEAPPVTPQGKLQNGKGFLLPNGQPMEKMTILTPPADYDPMRAMCGTVIQEWLRALGMPAFAQPMAFGALMDQVKKRRAFDAFILGYGALSLDPDWLRGFFHSEYDKPGGQNMSGYRNDTFDRLADQSAKAMDLAERQRLVFEMQRILMEDVPYIPLYNPHIIEGVRRGKYKGWVSALEGIGNLWSFCLLGTE